VPPQYEIGIPLWYANFIWGSKEIERGKGLENGSFPRAEILEPRGSKSDPELVEGERVRFP